MGLQLRYCSKMRQSNFLHQHWAIFKHSVSLSHVCAVCSCCAQTNFHFLLLLSAVAAAACFVLSFLILQLSASYFYCSFFL